MGFCILSPTGLGGGNSIAGTPPRSLPPPARRDAEGKWVADFADDERAVEAMEVIQKLLGTRIERDGKPYRGIAATSAGYVDDSIVWAMAKATLLMQTIPEICWHTNRGTSRRDIGTVKLPLGPSGDG